VVGIHEGKLILKVGVCVVSVSAGLRRSKGTRQGSYMTSGIDYLAIVFIAIIDDAAFKGTLDGRVVVLDKPVLEILEYEGRFACVSRWGQGKIYDVDGHDGLPTEREPSTTMRFFLRRLAVGMVGS
jgi:hypothetical protein